ncbi:uncharacterized protein LOC129903671 [Solanum dulcamara]|uniref:uncharacterized protein LOC129903671 n=1 Tax=Solanum dulcamara TaxID=45834 RepID=UPI00248552C0|nr:uncharacterized protein LOC129903671 [Solanum dulcamara]
MVNKVHRINRLRALVQPPRKGGRGDSQGYSLVVDLMYQSCVVAILGDDTRPDLIVLDMMDFDLILGMDWLSTHHTVLNCFSKNVTLCIPSIPQISSHVPYGVIFFLRAQQLIGKGYLANLIYVYETSAETPSVHSILVVWEFPNIIPTNLPGLFSERDIDFGIDVEFGTQ